MFNSAHSRSVLLMAKHGAIDVVPKWQWAEVDMSPVLFSCFLDSNAKQGSHLDEYLQRNIAMVFLWAGP